MNSASQAPTMQQHSDNPLVALVPRINIHAFCDNQQTAEAMQAAAIDRRMSRAHVTIQLGGIMAAVQVFQSQPTPNVLIVESHGSRDVILAELAQLASVCQPNTKVVVVGHLNDVILYRELIRQGVSEYLVAPLHQMQVIETIANLYNDPKAAPVGRIVAFVGAKGGVGSSTIAHNFAWQMSKRYATDTVITDLDLAFGTAGLNFNQDAAGGIIDALGQPDRIDATLIDRLLTKLGDKLSLLSGPGGVDRDFNIEAHAVETILGAIRGSVPCIVVDVPNMWAPWIKYTLVHSDQVVITATPELASLRNAKSIFDMLKLARPNDTMPKIVLNQVGVAKRPEIPAAEFGKALGTEISAIIPYDAQTFGTAQSNGQMIFEVAPKSKAAEAMARLAQLLSGAEKPIKASKFSLPIFDKLPLLRKKQ
ncbi:MAG: CtpF protein [Rhizobiales bacterium]|nr:CtpF protein [Hyphomicrobiales bacterium]MBI3673676.1 CtpF protein [Hyphomicrobiales bacterium]